MEYSKKTTVGYIPEIDSFRAVAVLFVLVFHAINPALPGGFIGVDIFFTISGFVIARRYLFSLISGETTLSSFFISRFRRLGPALILVAILTTLASVVVLLPSHLTAYGWSLAAQPLYLQNFVFWSEGDYFQGALTRPLLHTWSLALEEQFYLILGLMILLLRRIPRLLFWLIGLGLVLSYTLGVLIEPRSPKTAFFLLPARIWQFALGFAAVVVLERMPRIGRAEMWACLAGLGVTAMIAAAVLFPEGSTFPGPQALLACGGATVALIAAERASGAASMAWLRLPPVLYVGRISYGLYLWHWPPLSLWYMHTGQVAAPLTAFYLMVLATLGAVASYHLLENPIRNRIWLPRSRQILIMTLTASLSIAAVGLTLGATRGLLVRYEAELRPLLDAPNQRGAVRCGKIFSAFNPSAQMCRIAGGIGNDGSVLILGDSHADVLKEKIAEIGSEIGLDVYLTTRNCDLGGFGEIEFCSQDILDSVISEAKGYGIKDIYAISHWDDGMFTAKSLTMEMNRLVAEGFRVTVFQDVPEDPSLDPLLRAREVLAGALLDLSGLTRTAHLQRSNSIRLEIASAVSNFASDRVRLFDLSDPICQAEKCLYHVDGLPLYLDSNHLTFTGAAVVAPLLRDALTQQVP
jgi:peptidoglycan/LPS O-acetylase OafA/YrhL